MFGHPRERFGAALLIAAVLLAACGSGSTSPTSSPTSSQTPAPDAASPAPSATSDESACAAGDTTAGFQHQLCEIDAPSLAGNLLGDRAVLQVSILVPADYGTSGKRYPVVYSLAGFNTVGETLAGNLLRSLDSSAGAGQVILVFTGGFNALGGSFYVNSSVTGNWEDAIANDLVGYVDAHFRTVAKPAARGIAGHSMGGFGAVSVGMHRADVFGAIYAMSPGLFDASGAQARLGDPDVIDAVLGSQAALSSATPSNAAAAFVHAVLGSSQDTQFELAYGAAFAPDPTSPMFMRFPYHLEAGKPVRDDSVWKVWEDGYGGLPAEIQQYKANLQSLTAVGIDYGTADGYAWIPTGSHHFVTLLQTAGIPVAESTFDGGHTDRMGYQLANDMLPFMNEKLATS